MIIAINGRIFPTVEGELRGVETAKFLHALLSHQQLIEPAIKDNVVPLRKVVDD